MCALTHSFRIFSGRTGFVSRLEAAPTNKGMNYEKRDCRAEFILSEAEGLAMTENSNASCAFELTHPAD
jgi:hypothetical protein